jgi:hypothetical protein
MITEQRKEERLAAPELSKGTVCIPNSDQYFMVEHVRDITCDGIGLNVDGFLQKGGVVRLRFNYGKNHVRLYGNVMWCVPATDELSNDQRPTSFKTGISWVYR